MTKRRRVINEENIDKFKKKKKETDYEVVKSRSGLPMFVLPLPDGINFTEDEPEKKGKDE